MAFGGTGSRTGRRAVSNQVAVIVLLGMVMSGAAVVLLTGESAVRDVEDQVRDEASDEAIREVHSRVSSLAFDDEDDRTTLDFGERPMTDVWVSREGYLNLTLNGPGGCSANVSLSSIRYESRSSGEIGYEMGGLWEREGNATAMKLPPSIRAENGTMTLTVQNITGRINNQQEPAWKLIEASNNRTETVRSRLFAGDCARPDNVTLTVQSDYYAGWHDYLQEELDYTDLDRYDGNRTVVAFMNASTLPRAADDDRNQVVDLNGTDYVNVTVDNGTLEVEKNTSVEYPVAVIPLANGAESGDVRSFDDDTVYRPDLDVVFVVDESGSMQWNADPSCSTACQSKLEAAQEAMKAFNGKLNQSRDRAGLVGFFHHSSDESRYHLAGGRYLTDDFSLLNDTIDDDLEANGGTYMHAGLRKGTALMDLRSNSSRDKVMILLSDGENSCSCHDDDTKYWAEKAAENGVTIYSIGFGEDSYLNEPLLEEVANTSGGSYYHAENSSELDAVFDDIAREVTETRAVTRSPMSMNLSLEGGETFYPQINGDTSHLANGTAPSGEGILNVNDPTAPERFSFSLTVEDGENVSMSAMAFDCKQWAETDRTVTNASTNVTHTVVRCAEINDSSVSAVDPSNVTVYRDGENVSALLSNDSAWWQSDLRNDTFQPYLENGTETLDLASNQAIAVFDYEDTGDAHDRLIVLVEIGRPDTVEARSVVRLSISDIEVGVEDD